MSEKLGKIYSLKSPDDLKVRYVGFTIGTLNRRFSQHLFEAKKQLYKTSYKINWIRSLLKVNKLPIIELLEDNIPYSKWEERENYWINNFKNLTNYRKGGSGIVVDRTGSSKQRSANAKKIKVVQFSINQKFIKIWDSATDAVKILNSKGLTREGIGRCCKRKYIQSGGYMWAYYTDYQKGHIPKTIDKRQLLINNCTTKKQTYLFCAYTKQIIKKFESGQDLKRYLISRKIIKTMRYSIGTTIKKKSVFKKIYFISHNEKLDNTYLTPKCYLFNNNYYINLFKLCKIHSLPYTFICNKQNFTKYNIKLITKFNEDIVQSIYENI